MNKVKFQYQGNEIIFFWQYKGAIQIALRAKVTTADFAEVARLRNIAQVNMNAQMNDLAAQARALKAA